jgi:DNA-binding transcriptional regulator YiaG
MTAKCDCGGMLKKAKLTDFDLTPYLGLKVRVEHIEGLHCDRCGWETLPGERINAALHAVAALLLAQPERLDADRARYLRKYLGLTQAELGARMSVTRKTVNQWETANEISPQHDLILRALVYAHLTEASRPSPGVLDHVRTAPPKVRPRPLVVRTIGKAA